MYWYKTGVAHIEAASGGLEAGTNILVPAPAMGDPDQGVCPLRKPSTGEYAPLHSADEGAADLIESFRIAGTDDRFRGVIDAPIRSSTPGIADISVSSPTVLPGIGRKFSNRVQTSFEGVFSEGEMSLLPPPVRFCVNSISTRLGYHRLEVLYQFLSSSPQSSRKLTGSDTLLSTGNHLMRRRLPSSGRCWPG
jgi:hypothetical protein